MGDKLKIRSRKDGDRIIPIGMTSEKKVKDILINEKVPKEKRDTIPLVLYNEEIVWIAGIKGNEKDGPKRAAQKLFDLIKDKLPKIYFKV